MPIPQLSNRRPKNGDGNTKKYYSTRQNYSNPNRAIIAQHSRAQRTTHNPIMKKKLFIYSSLVVCIFLLIFAGYILWTLRQLPDPNHLIERRIAQSTKIYDRTGQNLIYEIFNNQKRTLVALSDIPDNVKNATIAIEDKDFYRHGAFSVWAIMRTIFTDIVFHRSAGGSTLTQQFVKNAVLSNEKTIIRKIKEIVMAYRLEQKFSKDQILQMYLNEIPYGSTAYGVQAASQMYFGKDVKNINLAEAAVLAALPQAPTLYSPYGQHKELLMNRQKYILEQMYKQGHITEQQMNDAKATAVNFKAPNASMIAPHFVMYIKEILSDKYGEDMVEQGGLKITTTIDMYKQNIAEQAVQTIGAANATKYNASNAALLSLDPKTGQILALVGSRDFFNTDIDGQVNIITSERQPGSSIKPLVYSAAFLKGFTPNTILFDVVTNFSTDSTKPYIPHNYDSKEHGPVTMRQALAGSLNVPAVKTLYLAGIDNVLTLAQTFGYTTFTDRNRFGLSLVLGGGEVEPLEHFNAFSAFAREGIIHNVTGILKVEDAKGNVLEEYQDDGGRQVIDPKVAREINNVLSDNSARAFVFGAKNYLTLDGRPVAAKTGTTNDYRDAWTIGYTPSLVTGVWVGNNNNKQMKSGADGAVVAAPIWHQYMQQVLGNTPVENFNAPDIPQTGKPILDGQAYPTTVIKIDKSTGLLATQYTPNSFIEDKIYYNTPHCILYYVNKENPLGAAPANPNDDPQYNLWEAPVEAWAAKQKGSTSLPFLSTSTIPTAYDNQHLPENQPTVSITTPADGQIVSGQNLNVTIEATAPRGINRAEYYLNGNLFYTATGYPFSLDKNIANILNNGFQKLKVRVCDDIDNCSDKELEFNFVFSGNKGKALVADLIQPGNNAVIASSSFPLAIEVKVNDPNLLANTIAYYIPENGSPILINNKIGANSDVINLLWSTVPAPGNYQIYAETYSWSGDEVKTNPITVVIQ